MRNDNGINLGGERVVVSPDASVDFLPEPGEHEARNLANVALNTEGFSPDDVVSVSENFINEIPVAQREPAAGETLERTNQGVAPNVVKIITTDRDIESKELDAVLGESEKMMSGRMTPFDFAQEIRGALEDATGGKSV